MGAWDGEMIDKQLGDLGYVTRADDKVTADYTVIGVDYAKPGSDRTIKWSQLDDVTTWSHHDECKCSECSAEKIDKLDVKGNPPIRKSFRTPPLNPRKRIKSRKRKR